VSPNSPIIVTLIGRGRIGSEVAEGLRALSDFRLIAVLGRDDHDLPPAQLNIDAAGASALRKHGAQALKNGDLWTVGAVALADPVLRARLEDLARNNGRRLRLFTAWIAGPSLCPPDVPARLFIRQSAPNLADQPGMIFRGPLADAAQRFPDVLNAATAAAITGPGTDATRVTLVSSPDGGPHRIAARFDMPGQTIRTDVRFDRSKPHPVAAAILAALARRTAPIRMGP
jgi:predicted dinucleotide-utilizing enzyme